MARIAKGRGGGVDSVRETQRERETDRDRHRERNRDRQTDRQRVWERHYLPPLYALFPALHFDVTKRLKFGVTNKTPGNPVFRTGHGRIACGLQ